MDPYEVGLRTVDGVRNNQLYVITHPEFRAVIVHRHDQLMAACDHAEELSATLNPDGAPSAMGGDALLGALTGDTAAQS